MIVNTQTGTRIDEIADGIHRISTPVPPETIPGGFSFNQYLIVDEAPLLYHTGLLKLFPLVRDAVASVIPVDSLRYIGFSHYETDECGSLNEFLPVGTCRRQFSGTAAEQHQRKARQLEKARQALAALRAGPLPTRRVA